MFNSFLGELKGYFGKAFVLAVWLPVFVFISAGVAVYLEGSRSLQAAWQAWLALKVQAQGVLALEFLFLVTLIAFFVHYLEVPITRFFEGYWDSWPVLQDFGSYKIERYKKQLEALDKQIWNFGQLEALDKQIDKLEQDVGAIKQDRNVKLNRLSKRRLLGFPPPGYEAHIMPTRLGNIYKSAELYPDQRYKADAVIIWPRLREVLPTNIVERLQENKIATDFLLLFGLLAVVFSLATMPYLVACNARPLLIFACALGLPLGWVSYRAALLPALAYAELVKVAFDLYRRLLFQALGLELPTNLTEERQMWYDLSTFIFRGVDPVNNWRFTLPQKKE